MYVWCWCECGVVWGSVGGVWCECGVSVVWGVCVGVVLECMCECGVGGGWGCLRKNCEIFYKQRLPFFKF